MGRARRAGVLGLQTDVARGRRLETSPEMRDYLETLRQKQKPLKPEEERAVKRALALIRGRGWPTEKIEVFFLDDDQLEEVSGDSGPWLPSVIGPTAVSLPRSFVADLNETETTRVILHEMSHARSRALPSRGLPDGWWEDIGLYQFAEGLTESVAERMIHLPGRPETSLLCRTRKAVEKLCQEAGLDLDAIERMSAEEAMLVTAENLDWSLQDLSLWIRENTGIKT